MIDGGLRKIFRKHLPAVHWVTIESPSTEGGIPDLNGCFLSREFWIEAKLTSSWRISLAPVQVAWHMRRFRAGGKTFIATRRVTKNADELWLFPGRSVDALFSSSLRDVPPLGIWSDGPARWDWEAILRELMK